MHTIQKKPITIDCFEIDDLDPTHSIDYNHFISELEDLRKKFVETKDEKYWKELIRWLPESWLQTRTVTMNYENLLAMCSPGQRRFHKLNEWSGIHTEVDESFIQFAKMLPYANELLFLDLMPKDDSLPYINLSEIE